MCVCRDLKSQVGLLLYLRIFSFKDGVNVNQAGKDGNTALHIAVCEGNADALQALVAAKGDVGTLFFSSCLRLIFVLFF